MQKKDLNFLEKDARNSVSPVSRRKFLNYSGLSAAALLFATSCKKEITNPDELQMEEESLMGRNNNPANVVNLGNGDIGILNYAYALEQLEAAFYIQVVNSSYYAGMDGMIMMGMINVGIIGYPLVVVIVMGMIILCVV